MACDPLFDSKFSYDSESVPGLVKFGHFTGETTSNRVFAVKNDKILQDQGVMACDILFDSEFTDDSESEINFMTTYVKKNRPQKVQKSQNPIFDMSHNRFIMTCSLFDSKFLLLQSVRIISIS